MFTLPTYHTRLGRRIYDMDATRLVPTTNTRLCGFVVFHSFTAAAEASSACSSSIDPTYLSGGMANAHHRDAAHPQLAQDDGAGFVAEPK